MNSGIFLRATIDTVARVSGVPAAYLIERRDVNLVALLGMDSIQFLQVWSDLETEFGLATGLLGALQATTVEAMASELARHHASLPPPGRGPLLGKREIVSLIPHRPPILMLDRVIELEPGRRGVGEKDLPEDASCFSGHFPDRPILPGVLLIEACAQLTAIVCRTVPHRRGEDALEYLAAVERFKFLDPVSPGEPLVIETHIGRRAAGLLQATVGARTRGRPVATGILVVTDRTSDC